MTEHDDPIRRPTFSESNPFSSPKADVGPPAWEDAGALNRGLGWLLFSFRGRIPRRIYWALTLGLSGVVAVVMIVVMVLTNAVPRGQEPSALASGLMIGFGMASYLGFIWISLATQAKRWHDRDKSAWWILINLVPYVGAFWVLIELGCLRGTEGPNTYGPDPT